MITGRQKSILFPLVQEHSFEARYLNPQICERKTLVLNLDCTTFHLHEPLSHVPFQNRYSLCQGGRRHVAGPAAHCASALGSCWELALSCYQQALSNLLFCFAKCDFLLSESTGKIRG